MLWSSAPVNDTEDPRQLVEHALRGRPGAMERLVARLEPVIRVRVARALLKWRSKADGRDLREEARDFIQEVFAALLAKDGHALKSWAPDRGLGFDAFVGFLAEREVAQILRNLRRSPWTEQATEEATLRRLDDSTGPEETHRLEARNLLTVVVRKLRERSTPQGLDNFRRLFLEQRPIEEIAAETGSSPASLYAWRSRLRKVLEEIRIEIEGESDRGR